MADPASPRPSGASESPRSSYVRRRKQHQDGDHDAMFPRSLGRAYLGDPGSVPASRRSSVVDMAHIDEMVPDDKMDTDTYGVSELRDGFFDGMFLKPSLLHEQELLEHAEETLPAAFDKGSPLAPKYFLPRQWHELKSLSRRVTKTRAGIRLLKSFTAFFIAYVLCLVPAVRDWLGRYPSIMVVSVIINHPARALGAQLDGAILTIIGTAAGLGWGVVGLLLSTSTLAAQAGYGGILALFLALFMTAAALLRSFWNRFYQAALCAGIAITFTTLAETSSHDIAWSKLLSYGIPWLLGQAIALVVNCVVFPDAGARALATTLHKAFEAMQEALVIPRPRDNRLRRRLAKIFVDLSTAARDLKLDISITRFRPDDVSDLRNLMQAVIRALLSLETETFLFVDSDQEDDVVITVHGPSSVPFDDTSSMASEADITTKVVSEMAAPTREVISSMTEGLLRCQAVLMDLSGYRRYLGPAAQVSSDIGPIQIRLRQAKAAFDMVESRLLESGDLPPSTLRDSQVVQLFVFARHVRETAATIENLMAKIESMQHLSEWPRLYLPSYPLRKALHRSNAQVRHDRGGAAATSYDMTFIGIVRLLDKLKSREHHPLNQNDPGDEGMGLRAEVSHATMDAKVDGFSPPKETFRHKLWHTLHRLQGFESRYAFKVCLVTTLLSVPGYMEVNSSWWDKYEVWWAVTMSWIAMHPRIGGNLQDLVIRASLAILGAAWSGAAYAAGNGNPYVMAVFAAIYMIPMLYRYTQSTHPRSGLVGCLSFTVISLGLQVNGADSDTSPALLAVLKGTVFVVGTIAPIPVNWVLWPFVARHELRYALSSMLFFMSVIYRGVVAKYVYFEEGEDPTPEDVQRSELLEGRLREGFVRIRQLLILTRKEMRLRAPFDARPYSALADTCERFFEYLIAVRQSALFYNPGHIRDNPVAAQQLLSYRRDAVASILANLYTLAGALRSQRKVPRYLPSAAAARKRLLLKSAQVEEEMSRNAEESDVQWHKKWSNIYSFSYNESLTGCVAQLEELERYTKLIVGEQSFDDEFKDEEQDSDDGHEES
ncbi:Brefeldin A-sensitivity protein 4 [Purpureocillium lilacinum]|uniref:Brefeldin A-sensitivity protein 4 n=2 Tax=Purpureocillium lilacinum TaxID=33203 RepID=A0A179GW69_PURLI|nr:Brefeldin A-sensitivity protein 4 [Purpureocillium lilacinum]OAQ82216.1 Brefeldin A-sensitivity protein 4 [Purpureocillium lilacinum]OAQ92255.1 Brefeldin A-sensitivity protein 4 [Purpureocillium lilacinum]